MYKRQVIRCAKRGVTRWPLFFIIGSLFFNPTPTVKSAPRELWPSRAAVERSRGGRRSRPPLRSGTAARAVPFVFRRRFMLYPRCCRIPAMAFNPRSTSSFNANGFSRPFSNRKRRLVATLTSALANTRANGVCASP